MIREFEDRDRKSLDNMQFELQKYFSEIDSTHESLPYKNKTDAHRYMNKMIDDAKGMNGKIFVAEENGQIVGFTQGVIIEHKKGEDEIYDLSHNPSKEGWGGLLYVHPDFRGKNIGQKLIDTLKKFFKANGCTSMRLLVLSDNTRAISVYRKNGFISHDLEMVLKF